MKKLLLFAIFSMVIGTLPLQAQWVVTDPTNLAQGIVNTTKQIVQTSTTASTMVKSFNETVKIYEQGKEYYDKLKAVNNLVKDAKKVQQSILLVGEITDIYVSNFQKMLSDPHYTTNELSAIAGGYAKLLQGGSDMLGELRTVVNANGLSMNDSERLNLIDKVHSKLKNQRDLVNYYTKKNISVSFLRAKKKGDTDRVISLYGSTNQKYW